LAKVLIYGIGFLTADRIARNVGVSPWSKYRYKSGLLHFLGQAAEEGHCFLPQPELIKLAAVLLGQIITILMVFIMVQLVLIIVIKVIMYILDYLNQ
jgi:ATP-dependent exoDNAse (exonuclease V) alpha subunit